MLGHPVVIAIAVAVFGVLAMLIVDHGPWTRPKVQTAEVASHKTTGDAARPSERKLHQPPPSQSSSPQCRGPSLLNRQTPHRAKLGRICGLDSAWLPQRMLTNAAHIAASPAPTKT
jgi:hypothetical protein